MAGFLASIGKDTTFATELQQTLAEGNIAVFNDLYWQHLAYSNGGLAALTIAFGRAEIHDIQYQGWKLIDRGLASNDPDLIAQGNLALLAYEQGVTLQPVYDKHADLVKEISPLMISILPGAPALQVAVPQGIFRTFLTDGHGLLIP